MSEEKLIKCAAELADSCSKIIYSINYGDVAEAIVNMESKLIDFDKEFAGYIGRKYKDDKQS